LEAPTKEKTPFDPNGAFKELDRNDDTSPELSAPCARPRLSEEAPVSHANRV